MKNQHESGEQLIAYLKKGQTPYHTVLESIRMLQAAGFTEWSLADPTALEAGKKYYTNLFDASLAAFVMPDGPAKKFRIAAAHTDHPCFRVKPKSEQKSSLYGKINVEPYGGAIFSSWLDRPLKVMGKLCVESADPFTPQEVFYESSRPLAVIPNLAIHMNRETNKGIELKAQTDMEAIYCAYPESGRKEGQKDFLELIADEIGVRAEAILDYNLYLVNAQEPVRIGFDGNMIEGAGLDNLTSCLSCLNGIMSCSKIPETISLIALFDHEECGSRSKQGAASAVLPTLMEKIVLAFGGTRMDFLTMLTESFTLSLDVAHASHPNHPEKSDPTNPISLSGGVVIKMNGNQKYATDTAAVSVVEALCRKNQILHQKFVNHSDLAGGGTIGSILSGLIPAMTTDIGVPMLAMHSSYELMDESSQHEMNRLLQAYFCAAASCE